MANFDLLDQAEFAIKRIYDDQAVYNMAYDMRPLYAWLPKKTGVRGGSPFGNARGGYWVPVRLDDLAGESADFGSAVTARDGYSGEVWGLNKIKRYATATIDGETMEGMQDGGAFVEAVEPLISSGIEQIANSIAFQLYQDGTGARGQIATKTATTLTLTAATSYMARSLSLKRTLVSSSTKSGGTLNGESTGVKIDGIVLDNGSGQAVLTLASTTNFALNDWIFPLGDYQATGENPKNLDGMENWGPDPATINPGVFFKGVERAKYKSKLLMLHYDVAAPASEGDGTLKRGIRKAAAQLQSNKGKPDALFVHPDKWSEIESDLESQSRQEKLQIPFGAMVEGTIGFDALQVAAGGAHIKIVADPNCPPTKGYMLQRNTWQMFSAKRVPDFVSPDGQKLARIMNDDAVEFRLGGYFNVACRAPGHNLVVNFN